MFRGQVLGGSRVLERAWSAGSAGWNASRSHPVPGVVPLSRPVPVRLRARAPFHPHRARDTGRSVACTERRPLEGAARIVWRGDGFWAEPGNTLTWGALGQPPPCASVSLFVYWTHLTTHQYMPDAHTCWAPCGHVFPFPSQVPLAAYEWLVCYLLRESHQKLTQEKRSRSSDFEARNNSQVCVSSKRLSLSLTLTPVLPVPREGPALQPGPRGPLPGPLWGWCPLLGCGRDWGLVFEVSTGAVHWPELG